MLLCVALWRFTGLNGMLRFFFRLYACDFDSKHDIPSPNSIKTLTTTPAPTQSNACPVPVSAKEKETLESDVNSLQETPLEHTSLLRSGRVSRTSPPFVASHDLPRGVMFAFQALLAYLLMLAVMCAPLPSYLTFSHQLTLILSSRTFQAAYIISIIVGLGLGEVLFGRSGYW